MFLTAIVGSQGTKLLHSVKKFSKKLSGQNMYSSDEYDDEDGDGTYLQDKKKSALCLWVSAAEVCYSHLYSTVVVSY
jgi:hypothetical protein